MLLDKHNNSVHQCELHNSTYNVAFSYMRGVQKVIIDVQPDKKTPVEVVNTVLGPRSGVDLCLNSPDDFHCYIDLDVLKTLSYQGVMSAFFQIIHGSISTTPYQQYNNSESFVNVGSNISYTTLTLSRTTGLSFLAPALISASTSSSTTLQALLAASQDVRLQALNTVTNMTSPLPLKDSLETMFENLTVSLMSSAALQPNYSSRTAPSPAEVTLHKQHNIYIYSRGKLWLPYGTAIFLTLVAVITGFVAILINSASYTDQFSTIFRVARGADIKPESIRDEDLDGKDPLPKYLSSAQIHFRNDKHPSIEDIDSKRIAPSDTPVDPSLRAREPGQRTSDATLLESPYWTANSLLRSPTRTTL